MSKQLHNLSLIRAYVEKHGSLPKSHAIALIGALEHVAKAQEKPFMFAIQDEDGRAYMDEFCVSPDPSSLEPPEGCRVVATYAAPPLDAMSLPRGVMAAYANLIEVRGRDGATPQDITAAVRYLAAETENAITEMLK